MSARYNSKIDIQCGLRLRASDRMRGIHDDDQGEHDRTVLPPSVLCTHTDGPRGTGGDTTDTVPLRMTHNSYVGVPSLPWNQAPRLGRTTCAAGPSWRGITSLVSPPETPLRKQTLRSLLCESKCDRQSRFVLWK